MAQAKTPFLTVRTHDGGVFRFEVGSSSVRIGRSSENDLVLKDPTVSRVHAMLKCRAARHYVIDLGSRGGTFLNDRRIDGPTVLGRGDAIRVGRSTLAFGAWTAPTVELDDSYPGPGSRMTRLPLEEMATDTLVMSPRPDLGEPSLLSFLADVDAELALHRPSIELYRRTLEVARSVVPFERAALMTLENGELVPQAHDGTPSAQEGSIFFSRSIADEAIREKRAIMIEDAGRQRPAAEDSAGDPVRAAICVPLWNGREVEGILYLDSLERPRRSTSKSLQLLTHLARIVAIKIENKRLFGESVRARLLLEELRHAADIQSQFLPSESPEIEGYRVHGFNRPSFAVGGDFYNYFAFEDGRLAIVLGDVAGNGLPAALLMCSLQPLVRAVVDDFGGPAEAMDRLNRLLCERVPVNRFITAFLAFLDPGEGTLSFASAGQNPPFVIGQDGTVLRLEPTGLPLGILDDASYGSTRTSLDPGSTLLIYSDGLTELANSSGEEFGEARLEAAAVKARALPPREMLDHLLQCAERHAESGPDGQRPGDDDVTAVIVQRRA